MPVHEVFQGWLGVTRYLGIVAVLTPSPKERTKITTKLRILNLAKTMPKIVKNKNTFSGLDTIKDELETCTHNNSLKNFEEMSFEDYWNKVGEVEDGRSRRFF